LTGRLGVVPYARRTHLSCCSRPARSRPLSHEDPSSENRLSELAFRDGIMDQIRLRDRRFHEHAYLFVLSALEFCQARLPERRHITGRELALSCRDLALDRYGVTARLVLEFWGVRNTSDIGDIVFTLVELHLLISQPGDSRTDFADVYDFDQAFEREYPWDGVALS
jgi:uncharacterized repeat protein (TIGR04138 family)